MAPTGMTVHLLLNFLPLSLMWKITIGGDSNLVQDPVLDRSSPKAIPLSKSAKTLNTFSKQLGLIDPWRHSFPATKSFSFFSNVHHTYTRIDFFLTDSRLLSKINSTGYHSIVISDHAPITVDLNLDNQLKPPKRWHFTSTLLSDDHYKQFLQSQIKLYFELNDLPCTSKDVLWEASKAYIRGQVISFSSNRKKEERAHITDLLKKIKEIDESYASNPQPSKYSERLKLQTEFDLLSTKASKIQLLKSKRFFESGDKAGRLLAQQTRSEATSRLIPAIKSDMGDLCTDATEINTIFSKFYANLYASDCPPPMSNILSHIIFPQVDPEAARKLGNPVTTAEIREAIKSLQCNKSPGPDGYTAEYYKTFVDLLAPVLRDVYNEAFLKSRLPETFSKATISLILKKEKDPLLCNSYRPISLLNVDFKILSKVLALRLQQVLPNIISQDQTGFMLGRHSYHNTRRLLNIIYSASSATPEIVVALDAEKAFDRVEREYLYDIMGKFGFSRDFISWVRLLYSSPTAS